MKTILRLFAAVLLMLTAAQALSAQDKGKEIYLDIMQQAVEQQSTNPYNMPVGTTAPAEAATPATPADAATPAE